MKLIDILVQELPKRGGWPGAIPVLVQHGSGYVYQAGGRECIYRLELADDWMDAEVTCGKYFDALRTLKPVWNGEGLPPVGCECEYSLNAGITWHACKIGYLVGTQGLVMHCDVFEGVQWVRFDDYEGKLKFRPIRSEADKKREIGVLSLARADPTVGRFEYGQKMSDGKLLGYAWYELYDKIAAGEVAGIRID